MSSAATLWRVARYFHGFPKWLQPRGKVCRSSGSPARPFAASGERVANTWIGCATPNGAGGAGGRVGRVK